MWDIFCSVVDNYGDVGVCWRLARALRRDHGIEVRLWVDDVGRFAAINPGASTAAQQRFEDIEVRHWAGSFPAVRPGRVVIEGFGCTLPSSYLQAMAEAPEPPVWINLEYLSAEQWVGGCHLRPSAHPRLPLTKHFVFPGFDADTGGLLRERGLAAERDDFQNDRQAVEAYWQALGMEPPRPDQLCVSLFCYANAALRDLLEYWRQSAQPIRLLVPRGIASEEVEGHLCGRLDAAGGLEVRLLPMTNQDGYDRLLWACDLNFVRGEDSFVRAQWAARPFVWQIYVQNEGAHKPKLDAFLDRYTADLPCAQAQTLRAFTTAWNGTSDPGGIGGLWADWLRDRELFEAHARRWAQKLTQGPELAETLVNFAQGRVK